MPAQSETAIFYNYTGNNMPTPVWRLTVRSDFASAHALRHYKGKCEAVHGHNFAVEIVAEGSALTPDTELLLDFKEMKAELKKVLDTLDHKDLNLHPAFLEHNPSSENIAAHIYRQLAPILADKGVKLYSVSVSEKPSQTATYMEI